MKHAILKLSTFNKPGWHLKKDGQLLMPGTLLISERTGKNWFFRNFIQNKFFFVDNH